MRWRRRTDDVPARTLREAMASLEWARIHDEPIPYTPVVLVDPAERERREFGSLWLTKAEGRLAWAFTMSSDKGQTFDEFMRQLRIIQRGAR